MSKIRLPRLHDELGGGCGWTRTKQFAFGGNGSLKTRILGSTATDELGALILNFSIHNEKEEEKGYATRAKSQRRLLAFLQVHDRTRRRADPQEYPYCPAA